MLNLESLIASDQVRIYNQIANLPDHLDVDWAKSIGDSGHHMDCKQGHKFALENIGIMQEGMDVCVFYNENEKTKTLKTHTDEYPVLIFCAFGSVKYAVYINDLEYIIHLQKNDAVTIPADVPHNAIYTEPRVCISVGRY